MPILIDADLRDPSPPLPGDKERAAVAARAHQLGRRRRVAQGAGALGLVAVVAVGVAALTAGGTSGTGTGTGRVQAANSANSGATGAAPNVTAAPAPNASDAGQSGDASAATPVPASTPSDSGEVAAPSTFTVSGTVANVPAGVTLTLTLHGSDGTFTAIADGTGAFSVDGIPPGTYDASYDWTDSSGTATQAGRLGSVTVSGDSTVNFALP